MTNLQRIMIVGLTGATLSSTAQSTPSPAAFPFSEAIVSDRLLFVSGQVGQKDGKLVTDSFEAEAHQVMQNMKAVLVHHRLTFADLINVTIFLTDMRHYAATNAVYANYFRGRFPARVCVAVAGLPLGAHIEIAGVATLRKPLPKLPKGLQ